MNAVIYARYSSERQTEQSIEGQMRVCKDYAKKKGYTIVNEYIDRAMSGKTSQRPGFLRMISDAEDKGFEAVIVYKLDRFARNRYDSVVYKHRLKECGVKVDSAMEQITDGAEGILVEGLLETMAELYSHDLSQKVKRGMNESFLKKQFLGGGIPLGYKIVDKKVKVDEETADAVKYMFESFAAGTSKSDLANELNKRGIKTSRGNKFTRKSFYSIFKNERYIGIHKFDGKVCKDTFPPIIDNRTFDKVRDLIKSRTYNKDNSKVVAKRMDYPLVQKVFCGLCGAKLTGFSGTSHTKDKHYYYGCVNRKMKFKPCNKTSEKKELLEDLVAVLTKDKLYNKEMLTKFAKAIYENNQRGRIVTTVKNLELTIKQLDKRINKIVDLFIDASDNHTLLEQLKTKHKDLSVEKADYENELVKYKLLNKTNANKSVEEIYLKLKGIYDAKINNKEERKEYFKKFINSVYVFEDKVVIYYNFDSNTKLVTYKEMQESIAEIKKQENEIIYNKKKRDKDSHDDISSIAAIQTIFFNEKDNKKSKNNNKKSSNKTSSKVLHQEKNCYQTSTSYRGVFCYLYTQRLIENKKSNKILTISYKITINQGYCLMSV